MTTMKWTRVYWVVEQDGHHYVGAYETDGGTNTHGSLPPKDSTWQQISEVQYKSYAMKLRESQ